MAVATVILVRHAEVSDNRGDETARLCGWYDPPLSARGLAQAGRLRSYAARTLSVSAIYTSPLQRASQTAQALGDATGLQPRTMGALREICCGSLEGMPLTALRARYPRLWERNLLQCDDHFRWPGGESYRAFRLRVWRAVCRILAAHPRERVAVVTHAGVISQILGALRGAPPARWECHRPGNASLTELDYHSRAFTVHVFDDRRHLA